MKNIGILSFQGTVAEHKAVLEKLDDVRAVEVKTADALKHVDAIILPGGESGTISKLMNLFDITEPLRERIKDGMPVWGTCAGLIVMAKEIKGEAAHLGVMDISVTRNAFGRQIDSFADSAVIPAVSEEPIPLVFIRAPLITSVGENVEILYETNGATAAARQGNMLATAFHPEFTNNLTFHKYFVDMVS